MITLDGKVALITGGGAGIGRAIAEAYGKLGAKLVIAEIDGKRAAAVAEALQADKVEALVEVADVTRQADVAALAKKISERFGRLDILVNNVGDFCGIVKPFGRTTDEDMDRLYAMNLRHIFQVTREMLPLLRQAGRGSSIISVSSIEGFRGIPMGVVYGAFKAAVTGFTQSLAVELGPDGIRVNTIAPETTETEQVKPSVLIDPKYRDNTERWIPLGRFGEPADCAGAAVYLASELSAWVSGTTIHVNGGALAAGGWYRTPQGHWTNVPVITANGISWPG